MGYLSEGKHESMLLIVMQPKVNIQFPLQVKDFLQHVWLLFIYPDYVEHQRILQRTWNPLVSLFSFPTSCVVLGLAD